MAQPPILRIVRSEPPVFLQWAPSEGLSATAEEYEGADSVVTDKMLSPSLTLPPLAPPGDFKEGLKHGQGQWTGPSGETYEGGYEDDMKQGVGALQFAKWDGRRIGLLARCVLARVLLTIWHIVFGIRGNI